MSEEAEINFSLRVSITLLFFQAVNKSGWNSKDSAKALSLEPVQAVIAFNRKGGGLKGVKNHRWDHRPENVEPVRNVFDVSRKRKQ